MQKLILPSVLEQMVSAFRDTNGHKGSHHVDEAFGENGFDTHDIFKKNK